eukprot:Gb_22478 [translate_table: standard]
MKWKMWRVAIIHTNFEAMISLMHANLNSKSTTILAIKQAITFSKALAKKEETSTLLFKSTIEDEEMQSLGLV